MKLEVCKEFESIILHMHNHSHASIHVTYSQRPHMTQPLQILGPELLHISIW